MANDSTACIYFALWIYILVRTIGMYVNKCNPICASWPLLTFTVFTITRIVESACLNIKVYVLVLVPVNIGLFVCGVCTFFFCASCLDLAMVIFLIVFCLQAIQMLIFICIISIYIIEEINIRRRGYRDEVEYEDAEEPLVSSGLDDDEITQIITKAPNKYSPEDTCSICLCDFSDKDKDITQIEVCGHMFHSECISGWLPRSERCPNCNTNVRNSELAINS
ncbi:unnamed protein product [Moneuplotes crassus]|uniref:RING-type domain-containing protein n=1 Tax=Euplotes crassus TaxID=5936 RepID=A0AAD2D4L1_EUPCR|nr:unnamed protein product [Moneuplotes crassus]